MKNWSLSQKCMDEYSLPIWKFFNVLIIQFITNENLSQWWNLTLFVIAAHLFIGHKWNAHQLKSELHKKQEWIHSMAVTMCCKNRFDQCTLYLCIAYYIWYYGTTDIRRQTLFIGLWLRHSQKLSISIFISACKTGWRFAPSYPPEVEGHSMRQCLFRK